MHVVGARGGFLDAARTLPSLGVSVLAPLHRSFWVAQCLQTGGFVAEEWRSNAFEIVQRELQSCRAFDAPHPFACVFRLDMPSSLSAIFPAPFDHPLAHP
jgi:hypothetical protein